MAVRVFDVAVEHEAEILHRIGVRAAARRDTLLDRGIDVILARRGEGQQHLALAPCIADRPGGELAVMVVRQQHDADRIGKHDRARLVAGELRVQRAADRQVEPGCGLQIAYRQIDENHLGHRSISLFALVLAVKGGY